MQCQHSAGKLNMHRRKTHSFHSDVAWLSCYFDKYDIRSIESPTHLMSISADSTSVIILGWCLSPVVTGLEIDTLVRLRVHQTARRRQTTHVCTTQTSPSKLELPVFLDFKMKPKQNRCMLRVNMQTLCWKVLIVVQTQEGSHFNPFILDMPFCSKFL